MDRKIRPYTLAVYSLSPWQCVNDVRGTITLRASIAERLAPRKDFTAEAFWLFPERSFLVYRPALLEYSIDPSELVKDHGTDHIPCLGWYHHQPGSCFLPPTSPAAITSEERVGEGVWSCWLAADLGDGGSLQVAGGLRRLQAGHRMLKGDLRGHVVGAGVANWVIGIASRPIWHAAHPNDWKRLRTLRSKVFSVASPDQPHVTPAQTSPNP